MNTMEYQEYLKDRDLQELLEIIKSIDAEKYPERYNYLDKRIEYVRKYPPEKAKDIRRTISSSMTFFFKFVFSTVWILGFGLPIIIGVIQGMAIIGYIPLGILLIIGMIFIYWGCIRLKNVDIDNENVYISNFYKEIIVPFKRINKIYENKWVSTQPVWIYFKESTEFGAAIMFMPKVFVAIPFCSHPIVKELRTLISNMGQDS